MHCPFCGNTLSVSARICYNCGHEFYPPPKNLESGGGCMSIIGAIIGFVIGWLLMVMLFG
jgi:hypothetical protein